MNCNVKAESNTSPAMQAFYAQPADIPADGARGDAARIIEPRRLWFHRLLLSCSTLSLWHAMARLAATSAAAHTGPFYGAPVNAA